MIRYRSSEEDSDRWRRFPFRDGDIVVSTRSKSGTTWMQQILVSMIHGSPDLPAPLGELSPWVDWLVEPEDALFQRLEEQAGRRVVKTHTPLDGVVLDLRAAYVVVVRDPLDVAVSLFHQGDNIDRERVAELTGEPVRPSSPRPPLAGWLRDWTLAEVDRTVSMDSLDGVVHHASDAWGRCGSGLVHVVAYADMVADLEGEMRALASALEIPVAGEAWSDLVVAASFDSMRRRAADRAPGARGVLKDPAAFFRRGRPGAGREVLDPADLAAYEDRVRRLAKRYAAPGEASAAAALLGVGDGAKFVG
ncbi:glycolipid sulfotransferase [Nocardioides endophyticus]|uniref:Glycolipid sulfotransferase n=1 Tax=Nocardioides endophyticus TaxID=1353775 RepID=A0ABP8ZGZ1_9ACTN